MPCIWRPFSPGARPMKARVAAAARSSSSNICARPLLVRPWRGARRHLERIPPHPKVQPKRFDRCARDEGFSPKGNQEGTLVDGPEFVTRQQSIVADEIADDDAEVVGAINAMKNLIAHVDEAGGGEFPIGRFSHLLDRGQKESDQDGDNGDHHQQLDEGKGDNPLGARGRFRGFARDPPAA